jgi:hypothetical protein
MTLPTDLREVSVDNLTIGRVDQVHFIEEAAAAAPSALARTIDLFPKKIGRLDRGPTLLKELP